MVADCNYVEPDAERPGSLRWMPGYDRAVLLTQDSDFVPLVEIVASGPLFAKQVC